MARSGKGQPVRPRTPTVTPVGAGGGNYFAGVLDELRKVVWPTWDELGRMTGVVVTTVILMAVIVSAADYGLGLVVRQLYTVSASATPAAGSRVSAQPTAKPSAKPSPSARASSSPSAASSPSPSAASTVTPSAPSTPSGTSPAPVTP